MECFSRKVLVAPVNNKYTLDVITSFHDIHLHIGKTPHSIYMDKGLQFNSNTFKSYCNEYNIKLIFSESTTKAALVEKSQRILQDIMFR